MKDINFCNTGVPLKSALAVKLMIGGGALGALLSFAAHSWEAVHALSGPAGAFIALVFGFLYGLVSHGVLKSAAAGGAITGAGSALMGILVGWLLGDQKPMMLGVGTLGGAVAGTVGGLIGGMLARKRASTLQ